MSVVSKSILKSEAKKFSVQEGFSFQSHYKYFYSLVILQYSNTNHKKIKKSVVNLISKCIQETKLFRGGLEDAFSFHSDYKYFYFLVILEYS